MVRHYISPACFRYITVLDSHYWGFFRNTSHVSYFILISLTCLIVFYGSTSLGRLI